MVTRARMFKPIDHHLLPSSHSIPSSFRFAVCQLNCLSFNFKRVVVLNSISSRNHLPKPYHIMTRTVKGNDRNHAGLADGTAVPEDRLPRYFAKSGHVDADPKGIKKSGGGKGNWGRDGDEVHDYGYSFTNERRRSNSSNLVLNDFKTKFEAIDTDPVFEEDLHGPTEEDVERVSTISKEESNDGSSYGGSVTEDNGFKKM